MAERKADAQGAWISGEDKTLHFTLSVYVNEKDLPADISEALKLTGPVAPFADYEHTQDLRDAMDPLFNDVANRERLGRVEDYLLDVGGPREGERVKLVTPRVISWSTEGKTYRIDLAADQVFAVGVRRFWYVHLNGAVSYHVSLMLNYEAHSPAVLFAMSMLQKAAAPKEFKQMGAGALNVNSGRTGILPLDEVKLEEAGGTRRTLWDYVAKRFDSDAAGLFAHIRRNKPGASRAKPSFADLVRQDSFLETPGLKMPRARFMFFFQDKAFFEALSPPVDVEGALVRRRRIDCVRTEDYEKYPEAIEALAKAASDTAAPGAPIVVDIPLAYLEEVQRNGHLNYLFLAGFNQNIIDFINQDASEVLDSTDPIYPATEEQEEESFFVRYANPRSLISYVRRSRSLETGNDWIGTCPYAFLIHVMALHNEYFVRAYEHDAEALVQSVKDADEHGELRSAAEKFYDFRKGQYTSYMRYRYQNVFRYDTEGAAFAKVEDIRGTAKTETYLETLITGVEKQTRDLEERLSKRDANRLAYLLALLSVGGFAFDFVSELGDFQSQGIITNEGLQSQMMGSLDWATLAVMSALAALLVIGIVLWWRKKI